MADFDPWSGKTLGKVSAPAGFEEYCTALEGAARGEKNSWTEQLAAVADGAGAGGGRAAGRGRGRGRYKRYNVPEPRAPRARPTHFVAVRLYSRMIRRNVSQMQQWFIDKDSRFEKCIVPVKKLHASLLLTTIPDDRRDASREACQVAGREIRNMLGEQPVKLTCSGVSSFNGQVLFARIREEPRGMLQAMHDILAKSFMTHGFPVLDENAKSWLDEDEEPHDFKAHASFIKVSKAMAHARDHERRAFRNLRVTEDDLEAWKDVFFGTQLCHEFELLDMVGSTRDGYYPCIQMERFNDKPDGAGGDPPSVHLAAGPLRMCRLRVESGTLSELDAGAGLQLSACPAGYLVEEVRQWPGQPDISEGDVIVSIADVLLLDTSEEELHKLFGENFQNGANVIVGNWARLQSMKKDHVREAAERLLRPWRKAVQESEQAETVSLYTEGGTRLPGLRYQLRTSAPSFTPDPLSGNDPWANAAERGYRHPRSTGWGTAFKTTHASKVDSTRFLSYTAAKRAPQQEHTKVHRLFDDQLRSASSSEEVLKIAQEKRSIFSFANRVLALRRLAAVGTWTSEVWSAKAKVDDPSFNDLVSDVHSDLDALEEAHADSDPAHLSGIAFALGKLGVKRPEIYRTLADLVLRLGLWTFTDNDVAMLLEGFSRSRLSNERVFQDASRLVIARVTRFTPRRLSTILTAFACCNIFTERLFFAAGDAIVADLRRYTSSLLSDVADAFARVRACHPLLLEVIPSYFSKEVMLQRQTTSVEALAKLFSAYVDTRESLGPDGLREQVADAIYVRRSELTARSMRQVLQGMARAKWPHAHLVEASAEVAARSTSQVWELEAMCDCFQQMRVVPPKGFPDGLQRGLAAKRQGRRDANLGWGLETSATQPPQEVYSVGIASILRAATLRVKEGHGAGMDLVTCEAGCYIIEGIEDEPGQPDLQAGDAIVGISGRMLLGLGEKEMDDSFRQAFADKAQLVVGPLLALQEVPVHQLQSEIEASFGLSGAIRPSEAATSQTGLGTPLVERQVQTQSHAIPRQTRQWLERDVKGNPSMKGRGKPSKSRMPSCDEGAPIASVTEAIAVGWQDAQWKPKGKGKSAAKASSRVWRPKGGS